MTTERDDLAEGWYEFITDDGMTSVVYVLESGNLYLPVETLMDEDFMGAARIYRLVRAPRVVTTVEELDALGDGALIRTARGEYREASKLVDGENLWRTMGPAKVLRSPDLAAWHLPATVLHEGDA